MLGVLIVAHELGHFWMARARGVRVLEFAIGMGPAIYTRQKKLADGTDGTKFSVRAFPIGGFCAMEGEDTASEDSHAFGNASILSRFLILVAGSLMNLLMGFLLLFVLFFPSKEMALPTLAEVHPEASFAHVMQAGDTIVSINGHRILTPSNVSQFLSLGEGRLFDVTLKRNGETITLMQIPIVRRDFGGGDVRFGLRFDTKVMTFGDKIAMTALTTVDYCRLVWLSVGEIISGRAGADDMMGPVGMGGMINTVITVPDLTIWDRVMSVISLASLITVNLAVFNLFPLPALDGGRIVFLIVEAIRRKPVPPKYEGIIHGVGMLFFFALMIFVFYNDIVRLIGGNAS